MLKCRKLRPLYIWRELCLKDKDLKAALDSAGSLWALPAHAPKNIS